MKRSTAVGLAALFAVLTGFSIITAIVALAIVY
jgi:hypothetical protein